MILAAAHHLAAAKSTTSVTLSQAVAAIIVILAVCGFIYIFKEGGWLRNVTLTLIIGVLVANVSFLHDAGVNIRQLLGKLGKHFGHPELTGSVTFTLIVILVLVVLFGLDRWQRNQKNENNVWLWLALVVVVAFFSLGYTSNVIIAISHGASDLLVWTQGIKV